MASLQAGQTVLCTVDWAPHEINQLRNALQPAELIHINKNDTTAIQHALTQAHIAILASDITPAMLSVPAPNLTWIHCDHAGLEKSACPQIFDRGLIVTSSAGRSAPALAQHAFYFALSLAYDSRALIRRQEMREWRQESREELRLRGSLYGRRLGILGFGNTGREIAALGRAFGMHVTVLRRRKMSSTADEVPSTVDTMLSIEAGDTVDDLLDCDVVMLAASLTDSTHHVFGSREFKRMKSSAIIVNIGRGSLIDESALVAALHAGEIAGAGLDVFEVEPLPEDSPLWGLPNVLITPHSTPGMFNRTDRSIEIIRDNIQRFRNGEPMLNQLRQEDIYTKARGR
ncbi:D-isomer specific 2-hydroxyacid dehydrogenase [Aspergillus carlsbadensis]|nr:D-isomer specific 2-hydroxyacid dehydrogenase [Aspergillus carlsbadensis]